MPKHILVHTVQYCTVLCCIL